MTSILSNESHRAAASSLFSGAKQLSQVTVQPLEETDNTFRFTLAGLNVSLANGLRRTIQDDIPSYVFDVKTCKVDVNTGRLHNEILKQRLQCIPIHSKVDMEGWLVNKPDHNLFEKYSMELDVQNNGDHTIYVTTSDFRIKNKTNGRFLTELELNRLFPLNKLTNSPVIFARLRPRISESVPGEHLKLSCDFAISTADENSAFTSTCCSAYGNTIDPEAADKAWDAAELRIRDEAAKKSESVDAAEIAFQKKNFQILDRQRYFVKDSFDFNIESVGVYEPRELCKMACVRLKTQFEALASEIESDNVTILNSEVTMKNCFDFILEHGDYTVGKILEYYLYENGFVAKGHAESIFQFCGFKKFHPHDSHSVIRVSYLSSDADKSWVKLHLKESCEQAAATFKALATKF